MNPVNHLETYRVKLRTIGPVFVGAGHKYGKSDYLFDAKNRTVSIVRKDVLMEWLIDNRKVDAYEKMGVLCLEDGRPSVVEYYEMSKDMAESTDEAGNLRYAFGVILNYLFRVDKLEEIVERELPVHVVEKKIPYLAEDGTLVKPEEPNGYKFETLVVDMIRMMDNNLPFEVVREREFAPIKNLHGVDSLDSARELLQKNGIEL